MKTAKELADFLRTLESSALFAQAANHLDRLAAIEAAVPGEVEEIERLCNLRADSLRKLAELGVSLYPEEHNQVTTLLTIVAKLTAENQALTEGVRLYRAADCPFAQPVQIKEWEAKHGHLVDGKVTT